MRRYFVGGGEDFLAHGVLGGIVLLPELVIDCLGRHIRGRFGCDLQFIGRIWAWDIICVLNLLLLLLLELLILGVLEENIFVCETAAPLSVLG